MNAKEAEEKTGISRRNLRFYEQQGLISPARNPENDYRDYSLKDVETLKKIRALRMLDVSLEDIAAVLLNENSLKQVMINQEAKLKKRQQELETAIRFCRELQTTEPDLDGLLDRMDQPDNRKNLFESWIRDYQATARAESKKRFSFNADKDVSNSREFTAALFAYGEKEHKDIVITKEGMYPEFTIDGIEYTAERECYYGDPNCPSDVVICEAVHPEDFDTDVAEGRGKFLRFFCHWWWVIPAVLLETLFSAASFGIASEFGLGLAIFVAIIPLALLIGWLVILEKVIYSGKKGKKRDSEQSL